METDNTQLETDAPHRHMYEFYLVSYYSCSFSECMYNVKKFLPNTTTTDNTEMPNYASVGGAPEAYGSRPVCVCVCARARACACLPPVSLQRLKGYRYKLQNRSNATISLISIP